MARALFVSNGVMSHYYAMVPLAWAMKAAGHDVRVAVPPNLVPVVISSGMTAIPSGDVIDLGPIPRTGVAAVPGVRGDAAQRRMAQTGARFVRYGMAMLGDVVDYARRWHPDIVIHEPTAVAGPMVASAFDIPSVSHRWGIDVGRAVVEAAELDVIECYSTVGIPYRGIDSDFVIDPAPAALQCPGLPVAQPIRFVPYGGGGRVPPSLPRCGDKPRALLTVGTVAGPLGGGTLLQRLADVVVRLGLQVIVAVLSAHRDVVGGLPDGVVVVESCPLSLLCEQVDVVVHHGGGTTLLSGLDAGLPQLVVPYLGDTLENGARLVDVGAGVALPFGDLNEERVAEATLSVLNDPSYRSHAVDLRTEIRSAPSAHEVAHTVLQSI